jgi:Holliday junction DNA helicase RuvA
MIALLRGEVIELKPTELVLDVGGVGYRLSVPFSTYDKIRDMKTVTLHVHTYHREDAMKLFGFHTPEEKGLFTLLLQVSGIGPGMALSLLSGLSIGRLISAVHDEDPGPLMKVPGIGRSKAEKLIFELKRRAKKLEGFESEGEKTFSVRGDAVEALISLGFDEKRSSLAVDSLLGENPAMPLEELIRASLKRFSE